MARRITSTLPAINGGLDYVILCEKSNLYQYKDGKRASDIPAGVRLTVALLGARLAPLSVKFDTDPLPKITDEQIRASVENYQFMYAVLPDCDVTLYPSDSGIGMTAVGKTVELEQLSN